MKKIETILDIEFEVTTSVFSEKKLSGKTTLLYSVKEVSSNEVILEVTQDVDTTKAIEQIASSISTFYNNSVLGEVVKIIKKKTNPIQLILENLGFEQTS